MAARFEVVLDDAGRFSFQLCAPEGDVLLTSLPEASKIMVQSGVLNARNSLRDPDRMVAHNAEDGSHFAVLKDRHGEVLARTSRVASAEALEQLLETVRTLGATAPLVDRTKRRPEQAAG
ncbi:MAG: hypothetical protein H6838_12080 [Planctomycetes bacterium]|nr:hypothetical protein [Planctomycetota bacterium]MCB9886226.1 hypothetical protein [Planctomycetota bacterium]